MLELAPKYPARGWVERRDPRFKVLVRAQVRGAGAPVDACVRDVSRRGMLIQASPPPNHGAIVEVIGSFPPVIGRVVWVSGRRFGVITQDRLAIADFLAGRATPPADRNRGEVTDRAFHRPDADPTERSRRIGRLLQYGAVVALGAGFAFGAAHAAHAVLGKVARAIESHL